MDVENICNGFFSEEISQENNNFNEDPLAINPNDYEQLKIINLFKQIKLLKDRVICPKSNPNMKIEKCQSYIDKYCWRCRSNGSLHDMKINIRAESLFDGIRIQLNALYYLIYNCFLNQYSINKTYNEMLNFTKLLGIVNINMHLIIKVFREVRRAIKVYFHKKWETTKLGMEPAEDGKSRIEIDESKIIGNDTAVLWMFGLIDWADKEARIYCVMIDRTSDNLLPIVKKIFLHQILMKMMISKLEFTAIVSKLIKCLIFTNQDLF